MREAEGSGASVDEALAAALAELGADREDVDVEILAERGSDPAGAAASPARVRVTLRDRSGDEQRSTDDPEEPDDGAEVSTSNGESAENGSEGDDTDSGSNDEWLDDQADLVADFLEDLFDAMDLPAEVEPLFEDGAMYVDVWAGDEDENLGLLIGRHGSALDALQEIVRTFVYHRTGERCQVVVDVEDYRKRRRAQIVSRAAQAAKRVQKTGRPERMDAMNAYERKIVHDAVSEISGVTTASEGDEPDRRVVIRRS